jgi:hypothetical protein
MLPSRRDALLASLFTTFALAAATEGEASPIDPTQTIVTLPDKIVWSAGRGGPGAEKTVESAALFGSTDAPGLRSPFAASARTIRSFSTRAAA